MGIPAHVTLLGPFMPPELIDDAVLAQLRAVSARHDAIDLALTSVRRFPGVLYLGLEPEHGCRALADDLAAAFPEYPPYEGQFERVVHHVTIARDLDAEADREVTMELARALPIRARIDHAQVFAFDADAYERTLQGEPGEPPQARVIATLTLGR